MNSQWEKVSRPPESALKKIAGGRLKGFTDINAMWRIQAMTEAYGPCGVGWKEEIVKFWTEPCPDGQVLAFCEIKLYIKDDSSEWSSPIPGIGGSMMIAKEANGLYASDECYKMAHTDALSVAMKALGVGAEIYLGYWDGSKYITQSDPAPPVATFTEQHIEDLRAEFVLRGVNIPAFLKKYPGIKAVEELPDSWYKDVMVRVKQKAPPAEPEPPPPGNHPYGIQLTCPEAAGMVMDADQCGQSNCRIGCPEYEWKVNNCTACPQSKVIQSADLCKKCDFTKKCSANPHNNKV